MSGLVCSPTARGLAAELGVDLQAVGGTGRGGRVTVADVRRHAPAPLPDGLGDAGGALWRAVRADYTLRADEEALLLAACKTLDELSRLEEKLASTSVTVSGSKGQIRPHPLIAEVRAHRLALRQLLSAIGISEAVAESSSDAAARSSAGRKLALIRHGGQRG